MEETSLNDFMELNKLNEIDRDRESLGFEDMLFRVASKIVKENSQKYRPSGYVWINTLGWVKEEV